MYTVFISPKAEKELSKLDKKTQIRILEHIQRLKDFPETHLDTKKLINFENSFRLRVGEFRILFSVKKESKEILVFEIKKRENVYR